MKAKEILIFAVMLAFGFCCGAEPVQMADSTVITSKKVLFDYKRMVAEFSGSVVVTDPQMKIESDALNVVFDSTNELKSATATGNVRITQKGMTATCNKAVYTAKEGKIVLTGDAVVTRDNNSVASDEITYWFREERMICNKPGKVIVVPDKDTRSAVPSNGGSRKSSKR